ncbi:hypothetical protein ACFQS7_06840 [Dankookia sp. GCM10030260]
MRDTGTLHRSGTGRGYSSQAELDLHTDGTDIVAPTCFTMPKRAG